MHTSIVSREFWEAKGGIINCAMDYKLGTADGQSEGLPALGLGPRTSSDPRFES